MLFADIIEGLEATSGQMVEAAKQQAWDDIGKLDSHRVTLLEALETAEEHILTNHLRECIANTLELDNIVVDLIRSARNQVRANELTAPNADAALAMYSRTS